MIAKYNISEIEQVAKSFLGTILNYKKNSKTDARKAVMICLTGELGAGKTTLMQNVGKLLNINGNIVSPTFVLRRDYMLEDFDFKKLIHIDAYRLDKPEMINQILTKDEIDNSENLIVIEWGELLDNNFFDLIFQIKHISETKREIALANVLC